MIDDPEDEAFNEMEQRSLWRKQTVLTALRKEQHKMNYQDLHSFRCMIIEEVAQHIEGMKGFGNDTINSFAIYIRGLK